MNRPHSPALSASRFLLRILRALNLATGVMLFVLARVFEEGTQMREDLQRMI